MIADNDTTSILNTVKKMLGLGILDGPFDADIIMHINSVFMILSQMGVGPEDGFEISDSSTTWSEYTEDDKMLNSVKSYVYLKVRLMFDPPMTSSHIEAINNQIRELEYRLYTQKGGY